MVWLLPSLSQKQPFSVKCLISLFRFIIWTSFQWLLYIPYLYLLIYKCKSRSFFWKMTKKIKYAFFFTSHYIVELHFLFGTLFSQRRFRRIAANRVTQWNFTSAFPQNRTWKSPFIRLFMLKKPRKINHFFHTWLLSYGCTNCQCSNSEGFSLYLVRR